MAKVGQLLKTNVSFALASRASETFTPNVSVLERSFSKTAKRSSFTLLKTVVFRNAENQLCRLLEVAL